MEDVANARAGSLPSGTQALRYRKRSLDRNRNSFWHRISGVCSGDCHGIQGILCGICEGVPWPSKAVPGLGHLSQQCLKVLVVIIVGTLWGILPVVFLVANGFVIGLVLYSSIQSQGAFPTLLMILPHGLFEIPAILLGTSAGLMLGVLVTKRLFGKGGKAITGEMGRALRFFLVVIIPLLLLAASIEAFLSS